jgi:hypothetical protein
LLINPVGGAGNMAGMARFTTASKTAHRYAGAGRHQHRSTNRDLGFGLDAPLES